MSTQTVTIGPDAPVSEAARCMRDEAIGDVIVVDGDRPIGIVTDRDIAIRVVAEGADPGAAKVSEACSDVIRTIEADDDTDSAVRMMRQDAIRRLPVVEGERLVGVISLGDLAIEQDERSALADISAAPASE